VRDFKAFQAAVISDYAPHSATEHELVLRLASLLWRLRRATAIETGLFELQADILTGSKTVGEVASKPASDLYRLLGLIASNRLQSCFVGLAVVFMVLSAFMRFGSSGRYDANGLNPHSVSDIEQVQHLWWALSRYASAGVA
jgi:hypothetical protein